MTGTSGTTAWAARATLLALLATLPARAEVAPQPPAPSPVSSPSPSPSQSRAAPPGSSPSGTFSKPRKALGAGAAIVPGLLVHGTGHLVAGDTRTGLKLLALEGAGLGGLVAGVAALVATGGSPRTIRPIILTMVAGGGLVLGSWLADLYGVLAPVGGAGSPGRVAPWIEAALGARYVRDPIFDYHALAVAAVDLRWRSLRLAPSAEVALDEDNARLRVLAAHRFVGPRPPAPGRSSARDGSFVDLEAAFTWHRYGDERFAMAAGEVALQGRLDLARLAPSLTGAFAELGIGVAMGWHSYDRPDGALRARDQAELLLGRFAFGIYLGHATARVGELSLYYDHRHDGYVGGAKLPGLGSGTAGHMGLRGFYYVHPSWGIAVDVAAGSALVGGVSVLYRYGAPPGGRP